jgi:acyl dehydratase
MTRWYEEIIIDEVFPLGSHAFTADEIVAFGKAYDPQYFHLSEEQAKQSHFGGLVASGWHTAVVGHRLMVDALFLEEARLKSVGEEPGLSGPSPGVNRVDFKLPVYVGDTITYALKVTGKRLSNSIPGWGLLFNDLDGVNQRGEPVYHAELVSFTKLRDYKMPLRLRLLTALTRIPGLGKLLAARSRR